jgi:hypothetical protein
MVKVAAAAAAGAGGVGGAAVAMTSVQRFETNSCTPLGSRTSCQCGTDPISSSLSPWSQGANRRTLRRGTRPHDDARGHVRRWHDDVRESLERRQGETDDENDQGKSTPHGDSSGDGQACAEIGAHALLFGTSTATGIHRERRLAVKG